MATDRGGDRPQPAVTMQKCLAGGGGKQWQRHEGGWIGGGAVAAGGGAIGNNLLGHDSAASFLPTSPTSSHPSCHPRAPPLPTPLSIQTRPTHVRRLLLRPLLSVWNAAGMSPLAPVHGEEHGRQSTEEHGRPSTVGEKLIRRGSSSSTSVGASPALW